MLQAEGVWFRYARDRPWVLTGDDLGIEAGEVLGLCGPSGGGKSTLGRVLAGHLRPDRGRVTVDGAVPRPRRAPHPVQLVLQQPERAIDPRWTVRQALAATGAELDGLDERLVHRDWLDRYPHEISGGELQRVNLARALLVRPRYLVADEISASLDAVTQARIWTLLLEHCREAGIGVLAISHDRPLLETVAGRVLDRSPVPDAAG
ncbi:peptide/nickel transport system ATP-binding protein [Blastococcus aurantiacus]|uniref:Peptide/nickel transport system ATP-binding protein n=1 Tax=Blastococcus aurantiacus TaxID=1550231 RepID=A0A1G7IWD8_9ACTN|nr:ATP-binding cassette domain-containing protein [Blastococcus aurantiacus]SDF16925.1 peptide/nickel transport system ATP-binding protein [Blastococcus aurantiacus]